ncbi:zinc ribbon domain-containing protein [Pseudomonas aeruginosa]|uniref:zinc ribbon domain-containing protein n=1 Tax=Pseudomonas aeruginosa TaxID=287 RepID=UPI002810FC12|nr:zinc ribbon domain-containing protein [Pseudomonas aeruginosa]
MGVIMDRAVVITAAVITAVRAAIRRRQSRREWPVGMACPACRTANAATARFCQGCGGALAPLRCIACSADLAAGAKFCGACGAPQQ